MNQILLEKDTFTIINSLKLSKQILHDNKMVVLKDAEVFESLSVKQIDKILNLLLIGDRNENIR